MMSSDIQTDAAPKTDRVIARPRVLALANGRQRCSKIDCCRCLTDAALLVGKRQDARPPRHAVGLDLGICRDFGRHVSVFQKGLTAGDLINEQDMSGRIGDARENLIINSPIFSGLGQFFIYILTL